MRTPGFSSKDRKGTQRLGEESWEWDERALRATAPSGRGSGSCPGLPGGERKEEKAGRLSPAGGLQTPTLSFGPFQQENISYAVR